jgi:nitrogen fixation NifU-like protein
MQSELDELYKQVILDHNKSPRNFGTIEHPSHHAEGFNPLCGDHIDVFLIIADNKITDIKFNGSGCAISKASASIMTTLLVGKTIEEAKEMFDDFHDLITAEQEKEFDMDKLGKLAVFYGVRQFPSRIKCASLAWHTLQSAIENHPEDVISTE